MVNLHNQKGLVIWLLGLSGAGKTTLSHLLKERLETLGIISVNLDGDVLRSGINNNLSFSEADRTENIRRTAEIAKLLASNYLVTICSLITPLKKHRELISTILGDFYFEVFVDCPLEVCEERDVKGLYKKARLEAIPEFTGVSAPFERPSHPRVRLATHLASEAACCDELLEAVLRILR